MATCLVSLCAVALMLVAGVQPPSVLTEAFRSTTEVAPPVETVVETPLPDCIRKKCVALTFDDGPDKHSTPALLDTLEKYDVPATFFVLGSAIAGNEEILKRMDRLGMDVASHTWNHPNLTALSTAGITDQLDRTDAEIARVLGHTPRYMRPPYGAWLPGQTPTGDMRPVMWEVDPQDWLYRDGSTVARAVIDQTQPGDIVLLHDIHQSSVDAVPEIIEGLDDRGFTFVLLDDIYAARPDCPVELYCSPTTTPTTPPVTTTSHATTTPNTDTPSAPAPTEVPGVQAVSRNSG